MSAGERFCDAGRGVRLCCETFGDPGHPPLVLIAGLGQQLNSWPADLCRALAARDLYVLRFDNRDAGRSSRAANAAPTTFQLLTRRWNPDQYTLSDMAGDVVGLLAANELGDAHLVGMSMGGMIGQTVAAQYPERVRTLTSIMSTTGARRVGRPALSTWRMMLAKPAADRETAIARALVLWRHIGSHGFPFDEDQVRALVGESWDRGGGAAPTAPPGSSRRSCAPATAPARCAGSRRRRS